MFLPRVFEHLSAVERCLWRCVHVFGYLWCPGGAGIALGGCLGEYFARIFSASLVVVVYVCAFVFHEHMSGCL